jgi:hypothetical protein
MNKLIKELESAGLSDIAVKDILSKYEVFEMGVSGNSSGMSSRDLMSSMVLKSLSVEGSEELMKCSLKSKKKLLNRSKSLSLEEECLNNECLDAFNESSAATGSTPIVVKKMSAKDKALEKALAKEEAKKAKEEAKALAKEEALKAKDEAKKAKDEAKAEKAKDIGGYTSEELKAKKAEKAAALKAQKAQEKLKAKEELKAQKVQEKADKAAELKAQKAQEKEALKNDKKEALKAAKDEEKAKAKAAKYEEKAKAKADKKDEKVSEKKEKKVSEKKAAAAAAAIVETDEVEEEPDVVKRFEFEGVKYLKSKNTGIIYNMEQDVIGKWNDETQKIDFTKDDGEEEEEEYDN